MAISRNTIGVWKAKCITCQSFSTCNVCKKGRKCDSYKKAKDHHSGHYIQHRICDAGDLRKKSCQCVTKKYYTRYNEISLQKSCLECAKIPSKCTSEG